MKTEKETCRSYGKVLRAQNVEKKKKGKLGCVAYQHVESQFYLQKSYLIMISNKKQAGERLTSHFHKKF